MQVHKQVRETERILTRLAQALHPAGVHLVFAPSNEWMARVSADSDDLYPCPFANELVVEWSTRTLWIEKEDFDYANPASWGNVIHEFAHLVAADKEPNHTDEFEFFGWEVAVAMRLGVLKEWLQANSAYSVPGENVLVSCEIGTLSPDDQRRVLHERLDYAESLGLVQDGRAVIRNPFTQEVVGLF